MRWLLHFQIGMVLLFSTWGYGSSDRAQSAHPHIENGVLNVSSWDFKRNGPLSLEGNWRVSWEEASAQSLKSQISSLKQQWFKVPGFVSQHEHPPSWDQGMGKADFFLEVRGVKPDESLQLQVYGGLPTEVICESPAGAQVVSGRSIEFEDPKSFSIAPYVAGCPQGDFLLRLRLNIPEFLANAQLAGIWFAPQLGLGHQTANTQDWNRFLFTVYGALLLAAALVISVEALMGRRENSPIGIAFAALSTAIFFWGWGDLLEVITPLSLPNQLRLQYAMIPLFPGLFSYSISRLLRFKSPKVIYSLVGVSGLMALVTVLIPGRWLNDALVQGQNVGVLNALFFMGLAVYTLKNRRSSQNDRIIALGTILPALAGIIDFLMVKLTGGGLGLTAGGVVAMYLAIVAVIMRRSAQARISAERLAESLAQTNQAISRFVPKEFLSFLGHKDVTTAQLGDVTTAEMTILFSDIRNFTTLSEKNSPEATFALLNHCLSRMGPHIRACGGFIDKFIGDAIMALFPGSPADAVRAAIAMQKEVIATNKEKFAVSLGIPQLSVGVGIHRAKVMMGTIGEEQRFEATVISDGVNLTSRLEALTKQLGCSILISSEVEKHLSEDLFQWTRPLGTFAVKGKAEPVSLWEVFAADSEKLAVLKQKSKSDFVLALEYFKLGDREAAADLFWRISQESPGDGASAWWLTRIERENSGELPRSEGGVVKLQEK